MKKLTSWHYVTILSIPLGIFLSLLYGGYGLLIYSIFNLIICHYCPDIILFQKAPDGVSQFSGKQYYKGGDSFAQLLLTTFVIIPVITVILILVFSPKEIADFIVGLSWLNVVNDDVVRAATYISEGPAAVPNITVQTLNELEVMKKDYPRRSLGFITCRIIAYCFLPILIAISTFDRTRATRSTFEFRNAKHVSMLKNILGTILVIIIFMGANYFHSAVYKTAYIYSRSFPINDVIGFLPVPFLLIISWMILLAVGDALISRPQSYFVKHASAYELYLQSKKPCDS